jgi:RNA-splicing ligase RtcB
MPDVHQGYGFPGGGVAATAPPDGVVSPGGVGYDINCGVRLLVLPLSWRSCGDRRTALVHQISRGVPAGAGQHGALKLEGEELDQVLVEGARALVEKHGIGTAEDLEHTESKGTLPGADPGQVSERAKQRGSAQLGTMGSGNHFVEVQRVERIVDAAAAALGADVAQGTRQVYDVAHNVAKLETHQGRELCVHRKGATRAFPGQPVFIPGSMGTASFVLRGLPGSLERSFGSACHGAGRRMSRTGARRQITGAELRRQLEAQGIVVRCPTQRGLAEEAPFAYKDVVRVVERASLAAPVARLRPLGVVKG